MKVKKTITEKVLAANRANAQRSTGPRRPDAVRYNALKHGIFTRNLIFNSDQEQQEFHDLISGLAAEYSPAGPSESALVAEAAVALWQLSNVNGWAAQEFQSRRTAADAILKRLAQSEHCQEIPLFSAGGALHRSAPHGWQCEELVVSASSASSESEKLRDDTSAKQDNWHVQAKLQTSLNSILRYQAALERKLFRALAMLHQIQRERLEAGESPVLSNPRPESDDGGHIQ